MGSKTVQEGEGRVNAELHGGPSNVQLSLDIRFYTSGASRVRIEEKAPLNGKRWEPNDIVMEHNLQPAAFRSLAAGDPALPAALATANLDNYLVYAFAGETSKETSVLAVQKSPFNLELFVEGRSAVQANKRGLFHFEHCAITASCSHPLLVGARLRGARTPARRGALAPARVPGCGRRALRERLLPAHRGAAVRWSDARTARRRHRRDGGLEVLLALNARPCHAHRVRLGHVLLQP